MNSNYKINKYKFKLKKAYEEKDYTNITKYYQHLKYHTSQGGMVDDEESIFLNRVCIDSNECITFGLEVDKIKKYFNYFVDLNYLKKIEKMNNNSVSGFINLLTYERNNYTTSAILKSTKTDATDNLYYEYLVGNFLNLQSKYFPCFVETYGLFEYKNLDVYECSKFGDFDDLNNFNIIKNGLIYNNMELNNFDNYLKKSCDNPTHICILIQYLKNSFTYKNYPNNLWPRKYDEKYKEWYNDTRDYSSQYDFYVNDYIYILFQIYMPLHILADKFTHYDLHHGNVLLYKLDNNEVIKYVYHCNSETLSFYSPYLVKIIDYGRSYFDNNDINTNVIYNKICDLTECNPNCGQDKGFQQLRYTNKKNITYDLLFLNDTIIGEPRYTLYKKMIKTHCHNEILDELINLSRKIKHYTEDYEYEIIEKNDNINNVHDLFNKLKQIILLQSTIQNNNNIYSNELYELHIFDDCRTPMQIFKKKF